MGPSADAEPPARRDHGPDPDRPRPVPRRARHARTSRNRARRRPRALADPQLRQSDLLAHVHRPLAAGAAPLVLHGTVRQPRQDGPLPATTPKPRPLTPSRLAGLV